MLSEKQGRSETDQDAFWDELYGVADGDPTGEMNIAHEVCDKHADDEVALQHVRLSGTSETITFGELSDRSNRFANLLENTISKGDRVISYMPRLPEQYVAMLGTLKRGAVWGSVSREVDVEGLAHRFRDSGASVVVTTTECRETVEAALDVDESVKSVIVVADDETSVTDGDVAYHSAMAAVDSDYDTVSTTADDAALLYYTSGTTGTAKGVLHDHEWVIGAAAAQRHVADLTTDDLYWSTSDLGWMTGPLNTLGAWFWSTPVFAYQEQLNGETCASLLEEYPITVLNSVPAVYRMLRETETEINNDSLSLRHAISIGAPLGRDSLNWAREVLDVVIHDAYKQTETGTVIIGNTPETEVRPRSMGRSLPGVCVDVVDPRTGHPLDPGETGVLAQRADSPGLLVKYWQDAEKTVSSYIDGPDGDWYLTGDLAHKDADGHFYFEGRAEDIIHTSSGRVGPVTVETALESHDAVVDSAVVQSPEDTVGRTITAFVVLDDDAGSETVADVERMAQAELHDHEQPSEIVLVNSLPKNEVGKIRRSVLRERVSRPDLQVTDTIAGD